MVTIGPSVSFPRTKPVNGASLQTVRIWLATTGSGLTVSVILKGVPTHPFGEVGVMVYSTTALVVVEFVMASVTFPIP